MFLGIMKLVISMKYLIKDQIKKIKSNLFYFISLSFLVLIISFSYTLITSSVTRLDQNHEEYLEAQNLEDFYFTFGEIDIKYLSEPAVYTLCEELGTKVEIECALAYVLDTPEAYNNLNFILNEEMRKDPSIYNDIVTPVIEEFASENNFIIEENKIINVRTNDYYYKFIEMTYQINTPYLVEGSYPDELFEIAVFPDFLIENNLSIGETYTINNTDYRIVGSIYKPEFLLPLMSMDQIEFDSKYQTLVLATEDTLNNLNRESFTKYLVDGDLDTLSDNFGYSDIQNNDFSFLGKNLQMVEFLMPADINFRIISLGLEIENALAFSNIFLPLFISFIALLLAIFMRRYVEQNKKDIFTLHALGYSKLEITCSILTYPFLISLQAITGYLLGIYISIQTFDMYSSRYHFPKAEFTFDSTIFRFAVIVPILLILIMNFMIIYLNINKPKKQHFPKMRVFKFVSIKTTIQTTILFLIISIMITFGLTGNSMFTEFIDYTIKGNNYESMIDVRYFTDDSLNEEYETYSKLPTTISAKNHVVIEQQNSTLYGIKPTSTLKRLIDNDIDNNLLLEDGVIVSKYLQDKLDLNIGDDITFTIGQAKTNLVVVGVSNELIENNLFMNQSEMNELFGVPENHYNGIYTTDDLYDDPNITLVINYEQSLKEFESVLMMSSTIVNFLIILSMGVSIFIFILIIMNFYQENRIPIAILKSIGYNNKEIHIRYLLGMYLSLCLMYIISIPITILLLNIMLSLLSETIGFQLILDINILHILIGLLLIHILFIATVYFINRYYNKIQISEIMKQNIK